MMTKKYYYIYIIYEDGSTYQSTILSQKDIDKIPKSKAYEAIKICYVDNPKYCHVIYGKDNIFLRYYDDDNCLYYSLFNDDEEFTKVIILKGVGQEDIFIDQVEDLTITFAGKLLPNDEYEKLRQQCEDWRPPPN